MRTQHLNSMESVSSVQMCKVNTLDCPGCCSTRMWCPTNPGFSACMSMFPSFPHSLTTPVASALKPCCKSWQFRKIAWKQTQHLGNDGTPLTSTLVTKTAAHKQGLASTSCSKETHVHWHKPMSCTIWGQQCVRDVTRTTHVCGREQLFFLFWWTNDWKMQPPTSVELLLRTISSSESRQARRWDPCHFWCSFAFKLPERYNSSISPAPLRRQGKDQERGNVSREAQV